MLASPAVLVIGLVFSVIGFFLAKSGCREGRPVDIVFGVAMMLAAYFVHTAWSAGCVEGGLLGAWWLAGRIF